MISLALRPRASTSGLTKAVDLACIACGLVFGVWGTAVAVTLSAR